MKAVAIQRGAGIGDETAAVQNLPCVRTFLLGKQARRRAQGQCKETGHRDALQGGGGTCYSHEGSKTVALANAAPN